MGVNATICVPRFPDQGRRDEVWAFVQSWYQKHLPHSIVVGEHPGPGEARAAAAAKAPDADVYVFADADTLAHPDAIDEAIDRCLSENRMVIAGDSHCYISEESSDRIMVGGPWFPRPTSFDDRGIYERPCSGVYAIPRSLYEACGGYPALGPHGHEDLVWFQLTAILSGTSPDWVSGHITMHLWHPPAHKTADPALSKRNKGLWLALAQARKYPNAVERARTLLAAVGHTIP